MRRLAPALVLAVLATVVPEVLFGSTPLTEPGRILVTMPIYAGGAILIRELARRRGSGWLQIAMLGVAFGIVVEGLALGSLFSPTLFNAALVGGRLFGVNWTWTEWTLGYHAIWSISIPIVPGVMPIVNYAQLARFSDACGAEIPRWMRLKLEGFHDDTASIRAFGVDVVAAMCRRLLDGGAPGLHFYTLNQATLPTAICERLGL